MFLELEPRKGYNSSILGNFIIDISQRSPTKDFIRKQAVYKECAKSGQLSQPDPFYSVLSLVSNLNVEF